MTDREALAKSIAFEICSDMRHDTAVTLLRRAMEALREPRFSKRERETLAMAVLLLSDTDGGDETRLEIRAMLSDSAPSEGKPQ